MKRQILGWVFFASLLSLMGSFVSCSPKSHQAPSEKALPAVVIGLSSNEAAKDLDLFKERLSQHMGMPITIFIAKDYATLVEKFKKGEIDFAFFTPDTFIQAEKEAGAKVLLKKVYNGNEFYYSAIVVKAESPMRHMKDLVGKKFGFVDPKSASGYLYPKLLLNQSGLDAGEGLSANRTTLASEFFGTHEEAIRALLEGRVDAVGVWSDAPTAEKGAWNQGSFAHQKSAFRVLKVSDPIPNDPFAVREQYYKEHPLVVFKMMEALIGMGEDPEKILKKVFDVDSMATATSRHYDSLRALESTLSQKK